MDLKRQEKILFLITLLTFFILLAFIQIFYFRIDITMDKKHTISKESKNIVSEIKEPLYITYYLSNELKKHSFLPGHIIDLLNEFSASSRGKIRISIIDPSKKKIEKEIEKYNIYPQKFRIDTNNGFSISKIYTGITLEYLDRRISIPQIYDFELFEYNLSFSIKKILQKKDIKIALFCGDRSKSITANYSSLLEHISQYYSIIKIDNIIDIDLSVNVLIILGNKNISESSISAIDTYITNGGSVLFCVDGVYIDINSNLTPSSLKRSPLLDLLAYYGIRVKNKIVIDRSCRYFRHPYEYNGETRWKEIGLYPFWVSIKPNNVSKTNPVTAAFHGLDLLWASPVEKIKSTSNIKTEILLQSSSNSGTIDEKVDPNPMKADYYIEALPLEGKKYNLACSLRGNFRSLATGKLSPPNRLIVIGDSDFASRLLYYSNSPYNLSFIENCISWLLGYDDLLRIRAKSTNAVTVNTPGMDTANEKIFPLSILVNIVIVPLIVSLSGFIIISYRKRKYKLRQKHEI